VIREIIARRCRSMADYERPHKDVKEGDRLRSCFSGARCRSSVAFTAGRSRLISLSEGGPEVLGASLVFISLSGEGSIDLLHFV